MIVFEFESDTVDNQKLYFLGCTRCVGVDIENEKEIYEQLDAELAFNL